MEHTRATGSNELKDLTNGHTYTGAEALAAVENAIGMNFEQLCRTTMLAQGDFTRFLRSEDSEKAAILQRLVGADVYERIGKAINRRKCDADAAYKTAKALCEQLRPLKGAELSEYKSKLKEARARLKELEAGSSAIDTGLTWLRQFVTLSVSLEKAVAADSAAREALDSEEAKDKRRVVDAYAVTAAVRADRMARRRAGEEINAAEVSLADCAGKAVALENNVTALGRKIAAKETDVRELDEALAAGRQRKPLYDVAETVRTLAGNMTSATATADELSKKIAACQKNIAEKFAPEVEKAGDLVNGARQALETADKEVSDCESLFAETKFPELRVALDAQNKINADLSEICRDFGEAERLKSELKELLTEDKAEKSALAALNERLPLLQELYAQSDIALEAARHNREITIKGLENDVEALRAMLTEGDRCPVCGAMVGAALPVEESIRVAVAESDAVVSEMRKRHDENGRKLAEAQADRRNCAKNQDRLARDIGIRTVTLDKITKTLSEKWSAVIDEGEPDKAVAEERRANAAETIASLSKRIAEADAIAARLDGLRKMQSGKRAELKKTEERLASANGALASARTDLARLKGLAESTSANLSEIRRQLTDMVSEAGDCLPESSADIAEYAKKLCEEKAEFVRRQENLTEMRQVLDTMKVTAAGVKTAMDGLRTSVAEIAPAGASNRPVRVADNALEAGIRELTVNVSTLINTIKNRKGEIGEIDTRIASFVDAHPEIGEEMIARLEKINEEGLAGITRELREISDKAASAAGVLEQCRAQLERHRENRPEIFGDVNETDMPQLSDLEQQQAEIKEKMEKCRTSVAEIQQVLELNQRTAEEYKVRKAEKKVLERNLTDLKVLDGCFGTGDGKRFRTIALSYILGSLIERANHYMETLTDRYRLSVSPGTFVILVADAYQGYHMRPTSSISGGESFMVSLSLALALSDISEVRGADILFIDEGFGSLSGQELDNAIETLRNLHGISQRRVGIISHLPRVSESLPVQILVNRATTTSPSTLTVTTAPDT